MSSDFSRKVIIWKCFRKKTKASVHGAGMRVGKPMELETIGLWKAWGKSDLNSKHLKYRPRPIPYRCVAKLRFVGTKIKSKFVFVCVQVLWVPSKQGKAQFTMHTPSGNTHETKYICHDSDVPWSAILGACLSDKVFEQNCLATFVRAVFASFRACSKFTNHALVWHGHKSPFILLLGLPP